MVVKKKVGRKRIRRYNGPLTTITVSDEIRNLISDKKKNTETYDDFLRRFFGI